MYSSFVILSNLAFLASGLTLDPRAACNADNCLRQLRGATAASSYCINTVFAAGKTVTVTPTVISIYSSGIVGTHTVAAPTTLPPSTTTGPAGTLPTFASSCTGASTRVASACSCLLSTTVTSATATVTATVTAATTTRVVCGPDDNYGVVYAPGTGNFQSQQVPYQAVNPRLDFPLHFTDGGDDVNANLAQCCRFCYQTTGCINYATSGDSYCNLVTVTGSDSPTPQDQICPYGLLADLDPSRTTPANAYYGIGQCAWEIRS